MSKLALVLTCALAVGGPAAAQMAGHGMPGMAADHAGGDGMMASMDKMSKDMAAVPMTGDSDRDFVAMMIPHHQGAIDMAEYELAHGKDPALRALAREIVAAQKKEIAQMKQWQAKHPAR